MTAEGDIGRLEGKVDMLIKGMGEVAETQQHMLTNGCALGSQHSKDIERLYKRSSPQKQDKNDSGSWISFGTLKAAGLPAIILALILGLAYYQRMETKQIANDVRETKENQEEAVARQAQKLAKMVVQEVIRELKP